MSDAPDGQSAVVPGQTPDGRYVLSVLLKRSYDIPARGGSCTRAAEDRALFGGDVHWGDPLNSSIRFETDFVPFRLATDVYLNGSAHAPGGRPVETCDVTLRVEDHAVSVRVIGERRAHPSAGGTPVFTDPEPFETMELRYERAYGGIDVRSEEGLAYPCPFNPLGRGFVVACHERSLAELALPNLEDPDDPLTPERLCVGDYQEGWERQPLPLSLGCYPRTWWGRARHAGVMPADRDYERELRHEYAKLVPVDQRGAYLDNGFEDIDFRYFSAASRGLALPYLGGGERIAARNLAPEGELGFELPEDRPRLGLDIGDGVHEPETVMQTVLIRMEERQLDITWRGAVPYRGPDSLPELERLEVLVG